jgi:hypothetical protein
MLARKNAKKLDKSPMDQAQDIHTVYANAWKKAEAEYKRKQSRQLPPSISEDKMAEDAVSEDKMAEEVAMPGCPSHNKTPIKCNSRSDYLKQSLLFHPDKNLGCKDAATEKFKKLIDEDMCGPFSQ